MVMLKERSCAKNVVQPASGHVGAEAVLLLGLKPVAELSPKHAESVLRLCGFYHSDALAKGAWLWLLVMPRCG